MVKRTRNYATVVYSDECIQKLKDLHIPCFISPWHDSDINANGEPKKPHRHILINYDSVKTIEQAKADILEFGGVGCEDVRSNRAYARYLCHLDNPEKAQYNVNDVEDIGGLDYFSLINSCADERAMELEICDYLLDNDICSFISFLKWCRSYKRDWYEFICHKHIYTVKEIIKSNYIDMKNHLV